MESTMLKRSKMVRWDVAFLGVTGFTGCLYPKEQRETKVSLMFSTGVMKLSMHALPCLLWCFFLYLYGFDLLFFFDFLILQFD